MIARVWHGWTSRHNADAYESLLRTKIYPNIPRVKGFQGAHLFRRAAGEEVEFISNTYFESLEAVRSFAGEDYERAVISDEAEALLARYDERAMHYQVAVSI
jgi:heme-degrading monooxygenase HmoA